MLFRSDNNHSAATPLVKVITTGKAAQGFLYLYGQQQMTYSPSPLATQYLTEPGGWGTGSWVIPNGDPCSVTTSAGMHTLSATGAGTCHVTYHRTGDAEHLPGDSNELVITIDKATPTSSFSSTSVTGYTGVSFTPPTLTTDSPGTVTYSTSDSSVAQVHATTGAITIVGTGSTVITANIAGTNDFNAAEVMYNLDVNDGSQTLSWDSLVTGITSKTYGVSFDISATSSAGLTPTYTTSGGCSVLGAIVTMTSGSVDCVITASQAGDSTHGAATPITYTVTATKATQNSLLEIGRAHV